MNNKTLSLTPAELIQAFDQYNQSKRAQIVKSQLQDSNDEFARDDIDLSVERTVALGNGIRIPAFSHMRFLDATDNNVYVQVLKGALGTGKPLDKLRNNGVVKASLDQMYAEAWLFNPAQAGKTISVRAYRNCEVSSGAQINSGTVTTSLPSVFPVFYSPIVAAATAKLYFAANTSARLRVFQNEDAADCWIGPSTVTNADPFLGLKVVSGGYVEILSTAALYVYSVAGCAAGLIKGQEQT